MVAKVPHSPYVLKRNDLRQRVIATISYDVAIHTSLLLVYVGIKNKGVKNYHSVYFIKANSACVFDRNICHIDLFILVSLRSEFLSFLLKNLR